MIKKFKDNSKAESVMSESLGNAVVFPIQNAQRNQKPLINQVVFPGQTKVAAPAPVLSTNPSQEKKVDEDKQFIEGLGLDLEGNEEDHF